MHSELPECKVYSTHHIAMRVSICILYIYMCVCAPLYALCVCNKCSTHTAHMIYIYIYYYCYYYCYHYCYFIVIMFISYINVCVYAVYILCTVQICAYIITIIHIIIYIYTSSLYCYVFTSCPLLGFTEHFRSSKRNLVAPLSEHLSCSIGIETAAKALVRSVSKHHLMWHVWL